VSEQASTHAANAHATGTHAVGTHAASAATAAGAPAGGAPAGGAPAAGTPADGIGATASAGGGAGRAPEAPLGRLALARGEVDRAAHLRANDEWLAAAWAHPGTRVLVVEGGRALITPGGPASAGTDSTDGAGAGLDGDVGARLVFVAPAQAPEGVRFLLGVAADGVAYFGVAGPLPDPASPASPDSPADGQVRASPLREAGPLLSDRDAGLMTHAVALANFHDSHQHCPRCGAVSEPVSSGHARRCTVEGIEEFPRSDPAMIVLVTDPADRCLLARNAAWPPRRVSILAGFVEAGESVEQAVAREVSEETGITVGEVRYLGSQPWPMPQSLMLGFRAEATGSLEITVDDEEIAEAGWFSRDELAAAIADGTILLPPPVSIAHQIIQTWYGSPLPGSW
jgi:NAD+ diphosphatase